MSSNVITFDVTAFRAQFPEFASESQFPNAVLQGYWDAGTCYVSDENYGSLQGECRTLALNYMTAHIAKLGVIIASGQTPGQVQSATIDKVAVSLTPPPNKNQWQWWLGLTPYGQFLLALLQARSVGGFYIPGLPEASAFRKWGGIW